MMVLAVVFADETPGNRFFNKLKSNFAEVWFDAPSFKYKAFDDEGTVCFSIPYNEENYFEIKSNAQAMGAFILGYLKGNNIDVGLVSIGDA